jgi:hypothetical protein
MSKHNKNNKFGGTVEFEPVRKQRTIGQKALDRKRQRQETNPVRPASEELDFFSSYSDDDTDNTIGE